MSSVSLSTAYSFDSVTQGFQFLYDSLALIALNFDAAVLHGPTRSAALFQSGCQFQQAGFVDRYVPDQRDALAPPSFGLTAEANDSGIPRRFLLRRNDFYDGSFRGQRFFAHAARDEAGHQAID